MTDVPFKVGDQVKKRSGYEYPGFIANGRPIGEVLETYTISHQVDVLVMGAYGHARWREFILGGATKSLLSKPPLPILFSH